MPTNVSGNTITVTGSYGTTSVSGLYGAEYLGAFVPTANFSSFDLSGISVDTDDIVVIGKKDGRPETTIEGASPEQIAAIMAALANSSENDSLAEAFREMAELNVTLEINLTEVAPSDFGNDVGEAEFQAIQMPNGDQSFLPDSTAVITIVGSRLDDPLYDDLSFIEVLGHELMHLTQRPGTSTFRQHAPGEEFSGERRFRDDLFDDFDPTDYLESSIVDLSLTAPPHGQLTPYKINGIGTDGNNLFQIPDVTGGTHYSSFFLETGAGNDVILVDGSHFGTITVSPHGNKVLYGTTALNGLIYEADVSVDDISVGREGDNLRITFDNLDAEHNGVTVVDFFLRSAWQSVTVGDEVVVINQDLSITDIPQFYAANTPLDVPLDMIFASGHEPAAGSAIAPIMPMFPDDQLGWTAEPVILV
ncbi:MAG: hypothetical protein CL804_00350 [Citromicrobium sp.]|nr:hypothetical protein [Citromicrobium sp.]